MNEPVINFQPADIRELKLTIAKIRSYCKEKDTSKFDVMQWYSLLCYLEKLEERINSLEREIKREYEI